MKIIIDGLIYQSQNVGGISRIFNEILPRMCEIDRSLEILFITTNTLKQPLPTHNNIQQHNLFPVDKLLKPSWIWNKFDLRSKYIGLKIGGGNDWIWHSTYYSRINQWMGKEVVTVYDLIYEKYLSYYNTHNYDGIRARKQNSVLCADAVICISKKTQEDVIEFYGLDNEKTHVVPLANNPIFRRMEDEIRKPIINGKPFLLYVGERRFYKNFSTFIRGFSQWKFSGVVDIVVVGEKWSEEEQNRLNKLKLQDNVHLFSYISDNDLVKLYNQAIAFVFPSLYEGFGIPLLEAMACGCPIIASQIPTTVEVAGTIPFYFDPENIDSFLAALDAVYNKDNLTQKVSAGLELVKNYSWDKTAKETLSVYNKIS